jgi:hypothetical protein
MPYIEDLEAHDYENKLEWNLNADQKIWRYMDIEQFLSLMHRSALRFGRADLFADEFEGTVPRASDIPRDVHGILQRSPEITNISCWHIAPAESMTMWEVYSNRGVVIESTVQRLRDSFCDDRKFSIQFAEVQYLDYTSETFEFFERTEDSFRGSYAKPFQYKREYYIGENEFRALTGPLASEEFRKKVESGGYGNNKDWNKTVDKHKTPGLFVTVDLDELLSSVVMSPYSSTRDYQAVEKLAERKHDIGDLVKLSNTRTEGRAITYHRSSS